MQRSSSSSSSDRQTAVLGETPQRVLCHSRTRSGSVSSTASRPAPAKSILSSGSSIRTRKGRSPPSVKFLDMPLIHYEDEDEQTDSSPAPTWPSGRPAELASKMTPPVPERKRVLGIFTWFANPSKKQAQSISERPSISGPFPLWEGPHRSESARRCNSPTSTRSIRSIRSTSSLRSTKSMRSVRSCASRIQGYWGRLSGRDP